MALKEERPGVWRGDLWHQGRRTKLTFEGNARDAKAYEARRRLEIAEKGIVRVRDVPTFESFLTNKYEPSAKLELRAGTWGVRRYQLKPLRKHFGLFKLTQISEQHIEDYKQKRVKGVGKVTINGELNVLSAILTYARELKISCAMPKIRRIKVRKKKGNARAYTRQQVGWILAATQLVAPTFYVLVKFLLETGARKSEAINLPWSRVDFERKLVRIWSDVDADEDEDEDGESADANDDDLPYEVKSVEREVTIPDGLVLLLKEQKIKGLSKEFVFPVATNRMGTKGARYAQFPKHTWARVIAKANELAKKADRQARPIAGGPHRCRHTFASHFLAARPDLFALGRILGHTHARVTELYSHLLAEHLSATRNIVTFEPDRSEETHGTHPAIRGR